MIETFGGRLAFAEGDEVAVDLELDGSSLRLATGISEIGKWTMDRCQIVRADHRCFDLIVDGDRVGFVPDQPDDFAGAVSRLGVDDPGYWDPVEAPDLDAALRQVLGPEEAEEDDDPAESLNPLLTTSVFHEAFGGDATAPSETPEMAEAADQTPELIDLEPGAQSDEAPELPWPRSIEGLAGAVAARETDGATVAGEVKAEQRRRRTRPVWLDVDRLRPIGLGLVVLAILAGLFIAGKVILGSLAGENPVPSTTETASVATTSPTAIDPTTTIIGSATTTPSTATVAPETIFDISAPSFVQGWNAVAVRSSDALQIDATPTLGPFELAFTSFMGISGVVGEDGTVDSYTAMIDPNGNSDSDRLGLQLLGVGVLASDPAITGPEAQQILLGMGLDVNNPQLAGIDGAVDREGLHYTLFYDGEAQRLLLTVTKQ